MRYQVVEKSNLNNNTLVMISGSGEGLPVGGMINGGKYKLLSAGIINVRNPQDFLKYTPLMIEGEFDEDEVFI